MNDQQLQLLHEHETIDSHFDPDSGLLTVLYVESRVIRLPPGIHPTQRPHFLDMTAEERSAFVDTLQRNPDPSVDALCTLGVFLEGESDEYSRYLTQKQNLDHQRQIEENMQQSREQNRKQRQ